jgi:glycosyltransferase involved in cell wall biosynthesis
MTGARSAGGPLALSVVVTTYNRASLLRGLLDALARQTASGRDDWEIVVVDNNSTDGTRSVVESAGPRVRYVRESRQGMSHARNRGIVESRGTYVGILDDDVLPRDDWVERVLFACERWRADGLGGPILLHWDAPPPAWLASDRAIQSWCFTLMDHPNERVLEHPMEGDGQIWGSNMVFRRTLFDDVGLFHTDRGRIAGKLYKGGEESRFVNEALRRGHRMVYDPSIVVHHRVGPNRMRKDHLRKQAFDHGEGDGLWSDGANGRRYFGVPRWMFRSAARAASRWLRASLARTEDRFREELFFRYECGRLIGHFKSRGSSTAQ